MITIHTNRVPSSSVDGPILHLEAYAGLLDKAQHTHQEIGFLLPNDQKKELKASNTASWTYRECRYQYSLVHSARRR